MAGSHDDSLYQNNWKGFVKVTTYVTIFVIAVVAAMAIFLL
jgi:hypothetical protein